MDVTSIQTAAKGVVVMIGVSAFGVDAHTSFRSEIFDDAWGKRILPTGEQLYFSHNRD